MNGWMGGGICGLEDAKMNELISGEIYACMGEYMFCGLIHEYICKRGNRWILTVDRWINGCI